MNVTSLVVSAQFAAGICAAAGLLAGCAAPVAVTPAVPADPDCTTVMAALPDRILGQERRPVDPDSQSTAAWGDPAITLRCGGTPPSTLTADASLTEINSVQWFAEELTRGYRFTTVDAPAQVEVTVPQTYAPEAQVLVALSSAVKAPTTPGEPPA